MSTGQSYDTIAERYRDSKRLPFRRAIERYTVFQLLGDLRGQTVLDLACGDLWITNLEADDCAGRDRRAYGPNRLSVRLRGCGTFRGRR